jgi:hypothetical protein
LAGETAVLGENLPPFRFVHHKPHTLPDANPGRRGGKPATNRLSYGKAMLKEMVPPLWQTFRISGTNEFPAVIWGLLLRFSKYNRNMSYKE